jgi:hypothetical protein
MQAVPLNPEPSQTLQVVLDGQNCNISVYTKTGYDYSDPTLATPNTNLYFDLAFNGVDVTTTAICLNEKRLLVNRQYLGFSGDFMFVDTQGSNDPQYTGLGSRYVLLYLEAADLAEFT